MGYLNSSDDKDCETAEEKENDEVKQRNFSVETLVAVPDLRRLRRCRHAHVAVGRMGVAVDRGPRVAAVLAARATARRQALVDGPGRLHLLNLGGKVEDFSGWSLKWQLCVWLSGC